MNEIKEFMKRKMSEVKVTKEKMLRLIERMWGIYSLLYQENYEIYKDKHETYLSIRHLIGQRPKKNRAFVERWVNELAIHFLGENADELSKEFCFEHLKAMLLMAGVEVSDEEEKNDMSIL